MKIIARAKSVLLAVVMVAVLCGTHCVAYAVDTPEYQIGITPTQDIIETLTPGETYSGAMKVKNTGLKRFNFSIQFASYAVTDDQYNPSFNTETKYSDMTDWITTDISEGSLEPGEDQEIEYTIDVPSDAHGGAQMISVLVTMEAESQQQGATAVETVRQLAFIIAGNVDGQITKTGKILENNVPSFLFNPPIFGTSLVENTGNVYTRAEYKLQVFPLFSDEEVYTNEEKPENNIIFPETKRYNEIKWEGAPQLGIFKVRQTVKIFDEESVTEKLVFLCPIWFLFIVILIIFVAIFWIVSRIMRRKKEA